MGMALKSLQRSLFNQRRDGRDVALLEIGFDHLAADERRDVFAFCLRRSRTRTYRAGRRRRHIARHPAQQLSADANETSHDIAMRALEGMVRDGERHDEDEDDEDNWAVLIRLSRPIRPSPRWAWTTALTTNRSKSSTTASKGPSNDASKRPWGRGGNAGSTRSWKRLPKIGLKLPPNTTPNNFLSRLSSALATHEPRAERSGRQRPSSREFSMMGLDRQPTADEHAEAERVVDRLYRRKYPGRQSRGKQR